MPYHGNAGIHLKNLKQSLTIRLTLLIFSFVVLLAFSYQITTNNTKHQSSHYYQIGLAYSQEVLIQRYVNLVNDMTLNRAGITWEKSFQQKQTAAKLVKNFDTTHLILLNGNSSSLTQDNKLIQNIPSVTSDQVRNELLSFKVEWDKLTRLARLAVSSNVDNVINSKHLRQVNTQAKKTAKHMTHIIQLMVQNHRTDTQETLSNYSVILIVGCTLFFGIVLFAHFQIVLPLERAAQRLTLTKDKTEQILKSVGEGICGLDLEGRITFINPAAAEMLGYEIKEVINKPLHLLAHQFKIDQNNYEQNRDPIYAAIKDGETHRVTDDIFWRRDKSQFLVEYLATPIRELNTLIGAVIAFRDVTKRKRAEMEREMINQELVEASRKAGMAEVATSVLHNVGNVLNSVNVTVSIIDERFAKSKVKNIPVIADLIDLPAEKFKEFIIHNPKAHMIPKYVRQLAISLEKEHKENREDLSSLTKHIDHIKQVISMQQSFAKNVGVVEKVSLNNLVDDAIQVNAPALMKHNISVVRKYGTIQPVTIDKHKVLQVLINLISNAKHALAISSHSKPEIILEIVVQGEKTIDILVSDNGVGIAQEHQIKIFQNGFTTKTDGHGYGLHSSALIAKEIGGSLTAYSKGRGFGAIFTFSLPINPLFRNPNQ